MKDLGGLMKQAQDMQAKLQQAQAKLAETTAEGEAGGGLVRVTLKGSGELKAVAVTACSLPARARCCPTSWWPPTPRPSAGWTRRAAGRWRRPWARSPAWAAACRAFRASDGDAPHP